MKIAPFQPAPPGSDSIQPRRGHGAASGATGVGGSPGSAVAFSSAGRNLAVLQDGSGDIDMARVQTLREAIANGKLTMDPGRIADGLLASVRELLR